MQKFFVKEEQIKGNRIEITGTDVNHIVNVLRMRKEDTVQINNLSTSENYIAEIIEYSNERIMCKIIEKIASKSETNIDIHIYQGLPKADKMELIIQKTTEIGVKKIIPVSMERCIVKLDEKDSIKKVERWQKISEVAAKQSKRDIIPQIENVIKISDLYEKIQEYDLFIVAYEEENIKTLKEVLKSNRGARKIGVLIGPEGGIDISEIQKLKENGAIIVTLGNRILRTETAPIVIASNIIYELEDN